MGYIQWCTLKSLITTRQESNFHNLKINRAIYNGAIQNPILCKIKGFHDENCNIWDKPKNERRCVSTNLSSLQLLHKWWNRARAVQIYPATGFAWQNEFAVYVGRLQYNSCVP